ncbi:ATPase, T2SS/T4P/T4SS family [Acerihabitans sp. TG2]|uniref:GspE/PulE family protein n=1 Tax=Acerihabitans sp. TG2 TaxID=3096008 RepID=UPI002B2314CD|nr:ATPase, T2SS/T4P/T4SS family [Acerihabitans sp. TG2]MEA9391799.1 ATPase, T2SS/T4P/T4SS family [Acerihabitans sp. TG2]
MTVMSSDTALEEFIDGLLHQGIDRRASDIHIEPTLSADYVIRMRIDGVLREGAPCPSALATRLVICLKIMAQLDIAERRRPQDGQFIFGPPETRCSFRVSTLPTLRGEKIVLRLLRGQREGLSLAWLGMPDAMKRIFLRLLRRPQGLVLLTGPTGSGKTMTLYAALNAMRRDQLNICSVEDPVEIPLAGVTQCQVNLKAQLDFATLLRALLRQDPDVIMVGEIRDRTTAAIAVHAAQTGHLVLSTVHALSAAEVPLRLAQFGVHAALIKSVLLMVMAQRLVRRLCEQCRYETTEAHALATRFAADLVPRRRWCAPGCEHCDSGYTGRCGVFHMLSPMTASGTQVQADGLWRAGLALVEQGTTSWEELIRVLGEPA